MNRKNKKIIILIILVFALLGIALFFPFFKFSFSYTSPTYPLDDYKSPIDELRNIEWKGGIDCTGKRCNRSGEFKVSLLQFKK